MNQLRIFIIIFLLFHSISALFSQEKNWIIQPKFDYDFISPFSEKLAPVQKSFKWGFINKLGQEKIALNYDSCLPFKNGLAAVEKKGLWGFINSEGAIIVPIEFDAVNFFSNNGLAPAKKGKYWGFIDKTGTFLISPQYEFVHGFSENLAGVKKDGRWGFIGLENNGRPIIDFQYDYVMPFSDGFAGVKEGDFFYFIDKENEPITKYIEEVQSFSQGLAAIKFKEEWGFIDARNKEIVETKYEAVKPFTKNGLAAVKGKKGWGYIDKTGKVVIDLVNQDAKSFANGYALRKFDNKWILIDTKGNQIPFTNTPTYPDYFDNSYQLVNGWKLDAPFESLFMLEETPFTNDIFLYRDEMGKWDLVRPNFKPEVYELEWEETDLEQPKNDKVVITEDSTIQFKFEIRTNFLLNEKSNISFYSDNDALIKTRNLTLTKGARFGERDYPYTLTGEIDFQQANINYQIAPIISYKNSVIEEGATVTYAFKQKKRKVYVLSIGTNRDLEYAVNDARRFANIFEHHDYYESVGIDTVLGDHATMDNIELAFDRTVKSFDRLAFDENDMLVVFFSSHGKSLNGNPRILANDYNPVIIGDKHLERKSIAYEEIYNYFAGIKCLKLLFIDACESGGRKSSYTNSFRQLAEQQIGWATFTSSSGTEASWENKKWGHGAFTQVLCEGLEQCTIDYDTDPLHISIQELKDYIEVHVPKKAREINKLQIPWFQSNGLDRGTKIFRCKE